MIGKGARMVLFIAESTESQKECGMIDGAIKLHIQNCRYRIDTSRRLRSMLAPGPLEPRLSLSAVSGQSRNDFSISPQGGSSSDSPCGASL
jgi:hypothetical protein